MSKSQLVTFGEIQVNVIEHSSGIFIGTNSQSGWSSHNKANSGLGDVSGDHNIIYKNVLVLNDNDQIDTPIDDRDIFFDNHNSVNQVSK